MEGNGKRSLNLPTLHQSSVQCESIPSRHPRFIGEEIEKDVEAEPVIIGGMVLDINATPSLPAKPRTTTPGKIHYALGGVARNVAECVSKLGAKPFLISVVGLDMAGNLLLEHWKSRGLLLEGIQRVKEIETAVVCNVFDGQGELAAAVASVESIERFLTPKWICQFESNVSSSPILMVDANLSSPSLEASCKLAVKFKTPVWFEPVSVSKSKRVTSVAKYITFASPNEDELIAMANALSSSTAFSVIQKDNPHKTAFSPESLFRMLKPAILVLLEKGIKIVVTTLGSDGVLLCSREMNSLEKIGLKKGSSQGFGRQLYETVHLVCPQGRFGNSPGTKEGRGGIFAVHFPALSASVARLTGAGDCLVGGMLSSCCAGLDVLQSTAVGIAAAKAAVQVETNVPAEFSLSRIAHDARSVYLRGRVVICPSML